MKRNRLSQFWIPAALFLGDGLFVLLALCLGWWLRYRTDFGQFVVEVRNANFTDYIPLLLVGGGLLLLTFAQMGLYTSAHILRRLHATNIIIRAACFWLFAYLCLSLVLRFVPEISRLFVVLSTLLVICIVSLWRQCLYALIVRSPLLNQLRQRVLLYGWNDHARALHHELSASGKHPYAPIGVFARPGETVPESLLRGCGSPEDLQNYLSEAHVDILICADPELPAAEAGRLALACERTWTDLKSVPGRFETLTSGLRLQVVGGVPLLGLEDLAISRMLNRIAKRAVDLLGASVGLLLSVPVILVVAFWIRRESPGPVFFSQERIGADNRRFRLWKLRSMVPDAALSDDLSQSTCAGDKRVLRSGRVLRRWNLDELPQFWNVLKGDMSLVGPRPERPVHANRLSGEISHYFQRHIAKPGMTGWAQVNGLRGACDLGIRIRLDHYYIENWSLWLDFQILAMTFVRWKNKAED